MAVNIKILIEGMVECQQQLLAPCISALPLTESKIRIDYLLYAANVGVSDHLLVFKHGVKAVYPFLKACEGTIGNEEALQAKTCCMQDMASDLAFL